MGFRYESDYRIENACSAKKRCNQCRGPVAAGMKWCNDCYFGTGGNSSTWCQCGGRKETHSDSCWNCYAGIGIGAEG